MKNLLELIPEIYVPVTLPLSKKELHVRAYKHGDTKHVLRAHEESKDRKKDKGKLLLSTLEQLVSKCIKEPIYVHDLNIVDFTYLMIYINSISKESSTELVFSCDECKKKQTHVFKLEECVVENEDKAESSRNVTLTLGSNVIDIAMREYTFGMLVENSVIFSDGKKTGNEMTEFMASFIEGVEFNGEYNDKWTMQEKCEFLDALPVTHIQPLSDHFDNIPKLHWKKEYECSCGHSVVAEIKEILDFFSIY